MKTFKPGQKVKNQYGTILTVVFQDGIKVYVREQPYIWYHPDKLWEADHD